MIYPKRFAIFLVFIIASSTITAYAVVIYSGDKERPTNNNFGSTALPQTTVEPALILTRQFLPNDIFRLLLPIAFRVQKPQSTESAQLTLTDIRFIGEADDWKKANLLGIAVPQGASSAELTTFLSSDDANADLKSTADRAMTVKDAPDWIVVMKITATWSQWQLTLTANRAEVREKSGATVKPPEFVEDAFKNPLQLGNLTTVDLSQVNTPVDSSHNLLLNVAMSFAPATITFALIPSEVASSWQQPGPGLQGLIVDASGSANDTSMVALLPHKFLNTVIGNLTSGGIDVTAGGQPLRITSPGVSTFADASVCNPTCFRLTGNLNNSANQPAVRAAIDWAGADLVYRRAKVVQNLCPATLECQTLELRARAGAILLNTRLTNPTGRLLRPDTVRKIGALNLNGKTIGIDLLVQNLRVTTNGLMATGFATLQPQ
jgi:hypothetical protein